MEDADKMLKQKKIKLVPENPKSKIKQLDLAVETLPNKQSTFGCFLLLLRLPLHSYLLAPVPFYLQAYSSTID